MSGSALNPGRVVVRDNRAPGFAGLAVPFASEALKVHDARGKTCCLADKHLQCIRHFGKIASPFFSNIR